MKKETVVNGSSEDCRPGCIHEGSAGGLRVCNYIFDVGKPRPCPGGPSCTEYQPKSVRGRHSWDKEKARAVYDSGGSVREIAATVGVSEATISKWLRSHDLTPNGMKQSIDAVKPDQTPDAQGAPLDVSIKTGRAAISISANSAQDALLLLTQVTQIYESLAANL